MCSRKRKHLRKLQALLCLVMCIRVVSSDDLQDLYITREYHHEVATGDLHNDSLSQLAGSRQQQSYNTTSGILTHSHTRPSEEQSPGSIKCPPSCFCEQEVGYASCVGDGQWAPPVLPSGLTRIEFRGYYLPEVGLSHLHIVPGIHELKMNQCNISLLIDDTFSTLSELDGLDLSDNHLQMLGPHSLRGLRSLRHLDLSANSLTVLKKPFTQLSLLQHLNLNHNLLQSLIQDTFQGLGKVQYIDLDSNKISFLEVSAFQHLTSLAHLILSNNRLSTLATLDFFGSRLQYIDVSNIGISRVPQALTQFVRDLRLTRNAISEIHRGDLDSYPYLSLLVLDNNNLKILEEDALGRHEYLSRLWLNDNSLTNIPLSLPPSLQALYLDENSISSIQEGDLRGLLNLQQLSLQQNNISVIASCAFCDLSSLKTLNLQGNLLTNLPGKLFSHLTNLESLDLSQNPLISMDGDALFGLTSVRVLHMNHILPENVNMTESLFDSLQGLWILELNESPKIVKTLIHSTKMMNSLRGLRELNIMHNGLTHITPDFPALFPKLQTAKLIGNSWDCSKRENIMWLKQWMEHSSINFFRSYSVRCASPLSLTYKPVILLEESDFETSKLTTESPTTITSGSTAETSKPSSLSPLNLHLFTTLISKSILENTTQTYEEGNITASENNVTVLNEPVIMSEPNTTKETSLVTVQNSVGVEDKDNEIQQSSKFPLISSSESFKNLMNSTLAGILTPSTKVSLGDSTGANNINEVHSDTINDTVDPTLVYNSTTHRSSTELKKIVTRIKLSTPPESSTVAMDTDKAHTNTFSNPFSYHRVLLKDIPIATPEKEMFYDHTREPLLKDLRRLLRPADNRHIESAKMIYPTITPTTNIKTVKPKQEIRRDFLPIVREYPTITPTANITKVNPKQEGRRDIFPMDKVIYPTTTPTANLKKVKPTEEGRRDFYPHRKDLWLYRGDSNHGVSNHGGVPLTTMKNHGKVSDEAVVGAGIVATCLGIALFIGGFLLAQGKAKTNGISWESSSFTSTSSHWRQDEPGEDEGLMTIEEDDIMLPAENSLMTQTETAVEMPSENHTGLNNRLYLLLQRDSSTGGITSENIPDASAY